jgi:hypothetical protein
MSLLDRLRRVIWRAEEKSNELEYAGLDAVHRVEDELDEHSGGRFYDTLEKADEEAEELLERLRLDERDEPGEPGTRTP